MYERRLLCLMILGKIFYLSGSTCTVPEVGMYVVPVMTEYNICDDARCLSLSVLPPIFL
jgi:hypothetical protein